MSRLNLIAGGLLFVVGVSSASMAWAQCYRYSGPIYRAAPRVVTPAPASPEVAQDQSQRRAFSYAPSIEGQSAAGSAPAARYYEPTPRYYSAPSMRRSSRTPGFLLPKTDPRKYRD